MGSKGKNPELDIVVKYKDKFTKRVVRTPKHIHWVIDLLIKKEHDRELTVEFIGHIIELLSLEEKTGFEGAFMFKNVLQAL